MPSSLLWAVDVYGRVYSLSTAGQQWEHCRDAHLEFKRVTAVQQCCWSIACDHNIYLYVHASDVPIRYQEETYENQRWNPVDGFSDRLLPSDRWQWSDVTGLKHQPLGDFQLPSENWEWEADWYVDENFGGEPTEKGGWTYAIDFPATYTKDKKWNSCVRRRRWIRYRRYKAQDTWVKIPSEQTESLPDPFNDITCGGWEITEEPRGCLALWAVSLQGKVWFRCGINHHNPEGSVWEEVPVPGEVVQISCGPGDLVWAVLWEGHLLVWFRRGVNSHNPCGSGWIGMVGEMVMINVGLNDQVWGIGFEDRAVYFRQGVTASELSGKTWKVVSVPRDSERSHSSASASSLQSAGCFFGGEVRLQSQASVLSDADPENERAGGEAVPTSEMGDAPKPRIPKVTSDSFISELVSDREGQISRRDIPPAGPSIPEEDHTEKEVEERASPTQVLSPSQSGGLDPQWSNVDLEEAQTHLASGPGDAAETSSLSSVATYNLALEEPYGPDEHPKWAWVSALNSSMQAMSLSITPAQTAAWRKQIFEQLSERSKREMENFMHYEQAIEQSVWVKKGTMQWWRDWKPHKWVDVQFALEQFSGAEGNKDGILFIYYTFNDEKKYLHVFINEVTILVPVLNDSKHTFAIYTAERTKQRWPIRLAAATELEMHDWLALLSVSCCDSRGIQGPPSKQAIWSVTCKGDIFVSEPTKELEASPYPTPCDQMFWRQIGGHLRIIETNSLGVVWGIGYDHTAWVHTGGYGGGFFQGLASSTDNIYTQTDVKSVYIYENQRWNPVTGYTNRGLPTDRYMWSDASGLKECTKNNTKPPSPNWTWVCAVVYFPPVSDWTIDYAVQGGTDREGWQKCKLTTTGPWQEVPPIPLSDITILPCGPKSTVEQVPLWAISNKGDVLCRLGVTSLTPGGSSWLHVGTDQPFKSISIGAVHQVWAIAKDGSAFYRGSVSAQNPAGNLWYRHGVTPSYPQGSSWEHISNNVRKVSVGPLDQVWIIADKVQGSHSLSCGTVCRRLGVLPMEPKGHSWDYGIGGGWDHVTVRGNAMEAARIMMPSLTDNASNQTAARPPQTSNHPEMNGNPVGC
ncbi:Tectonin beta-propeller repeat-containing protein 1 [Labeo rohita]|uniref:Tectonin beta-propeller repeat-containing protein 1 n=1 Tax=Labeo rohita TaxID=84645 RepID=A0ABQ8M8H7_LABRO|nr:Tectonin beta-propeller repeat-containing protein 1 [Labeo rohita]